MQNLSAATFAPFLANSLAAVCFVRQDDAHCDRFLARLAKHAGPDLAVGVVDIDGDVELAADFGVSAVPTLAVFKKRHLAFLEAGAFEAGALERVLDAVRTAELP